MSEAMLSIHKDDIILKDVRVALSNVQLGPWDLAVTQGIFLGLVGASSSGKVTLLKILSHALLLGDEVDGYFYSPHLRRSYVPSETIFTAESLIANLCFGSHVDATDDLPEDLRKRVERVVQD